MSEELFNDAPEEIYLNLGELTDDEAKESTFNSIREGEITWCVDKIYPHDIKYIKESNVNAARELDAKRIAWLELENKHAKEAINTLNDGKPLGEIVGIHTAQLQLIRIAELESQNKVMREALIKLRDCDFVISLPDRMDRVRDIAREALKEEG